MNFTEEAEKLLTKQLGKSFYTNVVELSKTLQSAYERGEQSGREKERERCATIVEFFPNIADGPADADERVKWAVKHIVNGIRSQP